VKNIIFLERDLRRERFRFTSPQVHTHIYIYILAVYTFLFYHFKAGIFWSLSLTINRDCTTYIYIYIYWASTLKWIYVTVNRYQKTMDNAFILRSAYNITNGSIYTIIIIIIILSLCDFRYTRDGGFLLIFEKIEYKQIFRWNVIWKYSNLSEVLFTIHAIPYYYYRAGWG